MSNQHEEKLSLIRKKIGGDAGLNRTGKQITYISLVCLAISLTGASIEKANTLLFEISFYSPKGLSVLLILSLIFLIIRYHGFAYSYFGDIKTISIERFERNPLITDSSHPSGFLHGVIGEVVESISTPEYPSDIALQWELPLKMHLKVYRIDEEGNEEIETISLDDGHFKKSTREKLGIAWCWISMKIKDYTNHPDHLNLLAPYFIGVIAITTMLTSFIKPDLIPGLIKLLG